MKFIQLALVFGTLSLVACAGDSSRKNADAASKQAPASSTRCPAGSVEDASGRCVQQSQTTPTARRTPVRDTLGRSIEQPFPAMPVPTGGLLNR